MTQIDLDDSDRALLRECPFTLVNMTVTTRGHRPSKAYLARLKRIKKLQAAGYIRGQVTEHGRTLLISLKNPGRVAIGRAPVAEVPADA